MKGLKYILILILIFLVCSARTCEEGDESNALKEENYILNLKNEVKEVFASDTLSEQFLKAFEITASDMINDFADYLKIISDTTLDLRFRQKSAGLLRNLFISDKIVLSKWSRNYQEPGLYTMDELLEYLLSEGTPVSIDPVEIRSLKPFALKNDSTWTGILTCDLGYLSESKKDTLIITDRNIYFDIYLIKKVRYFGQEMIKVWEVFLGDIN